jgi:hypothetical protein
VESKIPTWAIHYIIPAATGRHSREDSFSERIISSGIFAKSMITVFQYENNWQEHTFRSIASFHVNVVSATKPNLRVGSIELITWQLISRMMGKI